MSQTDLQLETPLAPAVRVKREKRPKDPARQRTGRRNREKGAEGEREVAALLVRSGLFPNARRRVTGEESAQLMLGVDLVGTPGLAVQVHLGSSSSHEAKLAEALAALPTVRLTDPDAIAVVFMRRPRREWHVTISAVDFIALLAQAGVHA